MRILYSTFLALLIGFCAYSTEYPYINYTIDHGLPSSQLYNMVQDRNNYLWFSSDHGLVRYNGYEFKTFGKEDGLPEDVVLRLYPQPNGDIWGATLSGKLFYFNDKDYVFHNYAFNDSIKSWTHSNYVSSLYITSDRSVYLSQGITGYTRIDSLGNAEYHINRLETTQELSDSIYLVGLREKGRNDNGSFVFRTTDPGAFTFAFPDLLVDMVRIPTGKSSHPHFCISWAPQSHPIFASHQQRINSHNGRHTVHENGIISLGSFGEDQFWVAEMDRGVKVYNKEEELLNWFLDGYSVTDVLMDHEAGVWVTTLNTGVFYIKNYRVHQVSIPNDNRKGIKRLMTTSEGQLFALYETVPAFYNLNEQNEHSSETNSRSALYSNIHNRWILKPYFSDKVIIGNQSIQLESAFSTRRIEEDLLSGEAYLIYDIGYFDVIHQNLSVDRLSFKHRIYSICNSGSEGWYIGTSKGLYLFTSNDSIAYMGDQEPLLKSRITAIRRTSEFHVIATRKSGIIVLNKDTLFSIDRSNGLLTNTLEWVYQENDSTFWACSNSGVSRIVLNDDLAYQVTNLTMKDGLPSNEVRDVVVADGRVWIATSEGVCTFENSQLESLQAYTDFLRIHAIYVNHIPFGPESFPYELSYTDNHLKFCFEAVSFRAEGDISYRYKIEELESEWNYSSSREANYPSLPYGHYSFTVQSDINGNGTYGKSQVLAFTIQRPFYSTWWFRVMIAFSVGAMVYLFFKVRILQYNRDIVRELLRHLLKKLKPNQNAIILKEKGKRIKVVTQGILYIQSSGNYVDIFTENGKHTHRAKIGELLNTFPDAMEFVRIHRSYIIRIDKIQKYDKSSVTLISGHTIPIGSRYRAIDLGITL